MDRCNKYQTEQYTHAHTYTLHTQQMVASNWLGDHQGRPSAPTNSLHKLHMARSTYLLTYLLTYHTHSSIFAFAALSPPPQHRIILDLPLPIDCMTFYNRRLSICKPTGNILYLTTPPLLFWCFVISIRFPHARNSLIYGATYIGGTMTVKFKAWSFHFVSSDC